MRLMVAEVDGIKKPFYVKYPFDVQPDDELLVRMEGKNRLATAMTGVANIEKGTEVAVIIEKMIDGDELNPVLLNITSCMRSLNALTQANELTKGEDHVD